MQLAGSSFGKLNLQVASHLASALVISSSIEASVMYHGVNLLERGNIKEEYTSIW